MPLLSYEIAQIAETQVLCYISEPCLPAYTIKAIFSCCGSHMNRKPARCSEIMLSQCLTYLIGHIISVKGNRYSFRGSNSVEMFCLPLKRDQGPVVQNIVSLTHLLVVKMLTLLVCTISNSQMFLLEKCE